MITPNPPGVFDVRQCLSYSDKEMKGARRVPPSFNRGLAYFTLGTREESTEDHNAAIYLDPASNKYIFQSLLNLVCHCI